MNLLFVSSSPLEYSASSNMRNVAFLNGFIENGYDVYTLTPMAQKDSNLYDETICNIPIKKKYYIDMGKFREKITMKKNRKNTIKKIVYKIVSKFKMYDFRSSLANKDIKIEEKFDLLISSSDPKSSHLIAEKLIKNNPGITKKWIQYWGDPFANDINRKNMLPKGIVKKEEKRLISICDKVIYVSPFTLDKQINYYNEYKDKMMFVPIPYSKEIIYPEINNKKITIGYFGDYRKKDRNIIPLYEMAKQNKDRIELRICGTGDFKLEQTDNIKIEPRQNLSKIKEYEKNVDILVCVCNKNGTQIPGKIYHYAATNKPILVLLDGNYKEKMKTYFEVFDRFILCDNNTKDIESKIFKFMEERKGFNPSEQLKSKNIVRSILQKI